MTQERDGFGQSFWDDLRWGLRFIRVRRRPIPWRATSPDEDRDIRVHPILRRFGDEVVAFAQWNSRRWVVLENFWHSWPDPARYSLFVLNQDDTVWMAWGFQTWPAFWRKPWLGDAEQALRLQQTERHLAAFHLAARQSLLLLCGGPIAFAGWWLGARASSGGWEATGFASLPGHELLPAFAGVFALATLTRFAGRRLHTVSRRQMARWRRRARDRWGTKRPRQEFASVYRSAIGGAGLGAAVLLSALLAGLGLDLLDQSLALIVGIALIVWSQLVLRLFTFLSFRASPCLAACGVLAGLAGWTGLP